MEQQAAQAAPARPRAALPSHLRRQPASCCRARETAAAAVESPASRLQPVLLPSAMLAAASHRQRRQRRRRQRRQRQGRRRQGAPQHQGCRRGLRAQPSLPPQPARASAWNEASARVWGGGGAGARAGNQSACFRELACTPSRPTPTSPGPLRACRWLFTLITLSWAAAPAGPSSSSTALGVAFWGPPARWVQGLPTPVGAGAASSGECVHPARACSIRRCPAPPPVLTQLLHGLQEAVLQVLGPGRGAGVQASIWP